MTAQARNEAFDADGAVVTLGGRAFLAHPEGALIAPDERVLVVADLHFEKGSAFAERGRGLLPPYDTAITLLRLARLIARYSPRVVVSLGDAFHDVRAGARIDEADAIALRALQSGRDFVWVAGNHDPVLPEGIAGHARADFALGDVVFRHEPTAGGASSVVAGHLHPAARVRIRGRSIRRRAFVSDGRTLVLPAFGAYAGGLNVLDRAFDHVFPEGGRVAWMLGTDRLYAVGEPMLLPD